MYVKINLLPKSYYEAKAAKNLIVVFVIAILVIIAGGIFWKITVDKQVAEIQKQIDIANDFKQKIDAINQEIATRQNEVAYYQVRVDAIQKILDFNKTIPEPFYEVAKWTYEKVQYKSLSINGTSVSISARARSLNDIARYILNLYKATETFVAGSISLGIEGMGGDNTGTSGMGSMPGMSGMPGASSPMPGGSQMSAGAIAAPAVNPTPSGMPGSMLGAMGGDMASIGNSSSSTWINFTVNATLKKAPTSPGFSLGGSNGSSTTGADGMGGMPGMSGMPGDMSGSMPGGMPAGATGGPAASPTPTGSATSTANAD